MKFRYKRIINRSIIILWILLPLCLYIKDWTLYSFLWVLTIFIIVIIFWCKNYIELDDISVKQVKYRFFKKKIIIIPYKEISDIDLKTNHTLSKEDVWNHCICATSWKKMEFWKIFHLKNFKDTLKEKLEWKNINISSEISDYTKYVDKTSSDYFPLSYSKLILFEILVDVVLCIWFIVYYIFWLRIDLDSITFWQYIFFLIPIVALSVFAWARIYNHTRKRPFVMLSDKSLIIAQNTEWKYKIQKIPYANIESIEINVPWNIISRVFIGVCAYIILKGKDIEEEINWLKDWKAFQEALKRKWIDVKHI